MNAFRVSHPNAMYNSQRPIALVSGWLACVSDPTVTWQADELGFDTAECKKKVQRRRQDRQTENETVLPKGGLCRLVQFRDEGQKSRG